MQTTNARSSLAPIVLGLTACLALSACGDTVPAAPETAPAPTAVTGKAGPGSVGLEGLMHDITMWRAVASDPALREGMTIGTTWGSNVSLEELIARLESGALLANEERTREPNAVHLAGEYYDGRPSGGSSISFIPDGSYQYRARYWAYVSCQAFHSGTTGGVRTTMRAGNQNGEWFLLRDYWLVSGGWGYQSNYYDLTVTPDRAGNNSFYMNSTHYCKDGVDTFYNYSQASASYSH